MDCKTETKRFFLGDSDSEEEWDEPKRLSGGSDCSSDDVVDGLTFAIDEDDSGIGMSMDGSEDGSIEGNDSSQIIPLRPVNIGKQTEHKQHRTRRSNKFRFGDFYELKKNGHLGSGAYASVSTCISRETGQEYAVKLVNKHEPGHTRSRILREVDVFKMCHNHPNIVQLIEWFEDADHFYMVFEKMNGGPLLSQIQNKGCFSEQEAAQVTKDIANALKFLHSKGVAHRDLKPENVLCVSLKGVSPVKLCDLDLASKPNVKSLRRPSRQLQNVQSEPDLSSPVGSAEFLAPEVVETFVGESLKYNRQCDMWSLGVITYIMLCGYVPFYGECSKADSCGWNAGQMCDQCQEDLFEKIRIGEFEFPEDEWSNISDDAKDLISHLLVKDVRRRYTANDVLQHPWISSAPETPLNTVNNLFKNTSTKDLQQFNDHFNINHFNRLSSKVEETIPSLGSTPPENDLVNSPEQLDYVCIEATKTLNQQLSNGELHSMEQLPAYYSPPQNDLSAINQVPEYFPPQMINMNGNIIYAPPMAQHQPAQFYAPSQQPYYSNEQPMIYNQSNFVSPPQAYDLNDGVEHRSVFEKHANSNAGIQRSITPVGTQQLIDNKKLQQHRTSLSTAISQLGLETCAMARQGSSGNEIHQSREAQVNV